MSPVSLTDLGNFLQNVLNAFDDYIFYSFVLMTSFSVLVGVRRLLVGVKQT